MVICGREFSDELISRISATIESEPAISRRELSRRVCRWMDWTAPNGSLKDMTCRTVLLKLHRRELIRLPEPQDSGLFVAREQTPLDIPDGIERISCGLEQLGDIVLVSIDSGQRRLSRIWNGLMGTFHYLGSGPLCGAQMRYLIKSSSYGWIGGLAFSAPAWRASARDRWIGWTDAARRQNLSMVICNSRFLLVPKVPHLASHILAQAGRRVRDDWNARYGIEPVLLETYVDAEKFQGTCYRAANWLHIGSTQGRGRMDRQHARRLSVKDIYVFPLTRYARDILCASPHDGPPAEQIRLTPPADLQDEPKDWVEEELGRADFNDGRLTKRLVSIARDLYARPQANIPQACQTRSKTKAAYRFFANPETTMEQVLQPHYQSTLGRVAKEGVVLAVQDTTTLNYSAHPATADLGPIGKSKDGSIGLILHDTMAFTPEGTPLGLLDVQCWARDPEQFGKKKLRHQLPIEQKESYKWLKSFQAVSDAQKRCPNTMLVSVGDREADIYELFELAHADPTGPKFLVRAMHNRTLAHEQGQLWETVSSQEVCARIGVRVPRRGSKPARDALLDIRFASLALKPPVRKSRSPELPVWVVQALEADETAQGEPVEWMLVTTCEVADSAQAVERVGWYHGRWGIEVYHRTLKSGCKIEERQLGAADRIEACLAIDMVVAWRVYHLTKLGRETPDVPCTVFFEDHEWKALTTYWTKSPVLSGTPPTLREAVRLTAQLGGFLGRKCDGEPGTKSLWLGLQRLDDLAAMYLCFLSIVVPLPQPSPVSSNPGYG
jgi:Druantia protein DruA/Transposase DNA-binding/Transposase Tn5 dimerisation domain